MSYRFCAALLVVLQGVIGQAVAQVAQQPDQERGAQLFSSLCAACHGATLTGGEFGPTLQSAAFRSKWVSQPQALLAYIRSRMPPAEPGSLSTEDYSRVVDHILRVNAAASAPAAEGSPQAVAAPATSPKVSLGANPPPAAVFEDDRYRAVSAERRALLDNLTPVTAEMLRNPPEQDWLHWRGTYSNSSFSTLKEINRTNVEKLKPAWSWSLPLGANTAPLVHEGVMFVNAGREVQALDAATGTLLWKYVRELPEQFRGALYNRQKNFAISGDRLYLVTGDRHVIALEMRTGKLVWDTEVVPPEEAGVVLSAGPMVVEDKVLQSTAPGAVCKGGCSLMALDTASGRKLWTLRSIAQSGEPGGDSWNGLPDDRRSGGGIWLPGSYDPQTRLVYYGVGGTYVIAPLVSGAKGKADALYTDSTLAIDPHSGRIVWHYQHQPRDMWDLDEAFERVLVELPVKGKARRLLITTGKLGIVDALDRSNGRFVFSKDLGLQNVVTAIDPVTGARTINPDAIPRAGQPVHVCPSAEGARNWMTTAFNPHTGVMYFPMLETCMDFSWLPTPQSDSTGAADAKKSARNIDVGWVDKPRPDSDGNLGRYAALDLASGKMLWTKRQRAPLSSSLLATDSGLLFGGDRNRMFSALDQQTGETLWQTRLNAVPNASPITYRVNGVQYIAIVAGGGATHDILTRPYTPEIENSAPSTTIWVFAVH